MRKSLCVILAFLTAVLLYQLGIIRPCNYDRKGIPKCYGPTSVEAQAVESKPVQTSSSSQVAVSSSVAVSSQRPAHKAFNIDVLARAVSAHETCGCTCGIVLPEPNPDGVHNCFGIKDKATGRPKNYASQEEAYADFKALWVRKYGNSFPTLETASKYVGHDGSAWLADVTKYYNRYNIARGLLLRPSKTGA